MKKAILLIVILLTASPAYAIRAKDYEAMMGLTGTAGFEINEYFDVYASGLGAGFAVVNSTLKKKGLPVLFCLPENLDMNLLSFRAILDTAINKGSSRLTRDANIADYLFEALIKKYPCTDTRN